MVRKYNKSRCSMLVEQRLLLKMCVNLTEKGYMDKQIWRRNRMKGQSYVILAIVFIIIIAVFAVTNVEAVEVNYLFWSVE